MEREPNYERRGRRRGKITFLPHPSPLFYSRHFTRGLWLWFLALCSKTARNTCYAGYAKAYTVFFPGTRGYIGSLSKDFFERRTSTETEALFLLVWLDATKFVYLSVFTYIKTICAKIWAKPLPKNAKKTTSGWCAPLKKRLCFNSWITSLKRTLKQITTKIRKLVNCPFFFPFPLEPVRVTFCKWMPDPGPSFSALFTKCCQLVVAKTSLRSTVVALSLVYAFISWL